MMGASPSARAALALAAVCAAAAVVGSAFAALPSLMLRAHVSLVRLKGPDFDFGDEELTFNISGTLRVGDRKMSEDPDTVCRPFAWSNGVELPIPSPLLLSRTVPLGAQHDIFKSMLATWDDFRLAVWEDDVGDRCQKSNCGVFTWSCDNVLTQWSLGARTVRLKATQDLSVPASIQTVSRSPLLAIRGGWTVELESRYSYTGARVRKWSVTDDVVSLSFSGDTDGELPEPLTCNELIFAAADEPAKFTVSARVAGRANSYVLCNSITRQAGAKRTVLEIVVFYSAVIDPGRRMRVPLLATRSDASGELASADDYTLQVRDATSWVRWPWPLFDEADGVVKSVALELDTSNADRNVPGAERVLYGVIEWAPRASAPVPSPDKGNTPSGPLIDGGGKAPSSSPGGGAASPSGDGGGPRGGDPCGGVDCGDGGEVQCRGPASTCQCYDSYELSDNGRSCVAVPVMPTPPPDVLIIVGPTPPPSDGQSPSGGSAAPGATQPSVIAGVDDTTLAAGIGAGVGGCSLLLGACALLCVAHRRRRHARAGWDDAGGGMAVSNIVLTEASQAAAADEMHTSSATLDTMATTSEFGRSSSPPSSVDGKQAQAYGTYY